MPIILRFEKLPTIPAAPSDETDETKKPQPQLRAKVTGQLEGDTKAAPISEEYDPARGQARTFAVHGVLSKLRDAYPDEGV